MVSKSPLSLLLVLAVAVQVQAQNTQNTQNTNTATGTQQQTAGTVTQAQTTQQQTDTNTATTAKATATLSTITDVPTLSSGNDLTAAQSSTVPTTEITNAPSLSTSTSVFHLSDVPTIAGYGIPTAVVPWTAGAGYQQKSNLPEGTVFIAVGALLGFMGMAVLAWRGMVAWSLHRSVKRAAANALKTDTSMMKMSKSTPPFAGGGHHKHSGSTHSLERLSAAPTGRLTKTAHGPPPGTANGARNSSLFFSPTAGAGNHSSPAAALLNQSNNRSSAYLPAGYYAAPGAATPAQGGHGMATLGGTGSPSPLSSMNPLHPSRAGYRPQRDYGPSPPESPALQPTRGSEDVLRRGHNAGRGHGYDDRGSGYGNSGMYNNQSPSILNLHVPGGSVSGGRAPSANLEELFENHGNGPRERF